MEKPGLIVAPLTPFTADLGVDEPALRRQIDYVVTDCGATMVVAAGVETQEYTYLGLEQRKALIRATIEAVDGRVPVMVGISHPSFKTAVALAHEAERLGAAAVQLLAPLRPFAGAPTQGDLLAYFEAVGRETGLPITLYLNPGPGADVSIADTIALAKLPRVQLIKESSRDLARVSRLIVEIRSSWAGPAPPCRRPDRRSRGTSSTRSSPRITSAPLPCSCSSRCSRRSGCTGASPRS